MDDTIYAALAIPYKQENDEYKFLLLKHIKGYWAFPGGAKEASDNSLEDTLIREIQEEIGLKINSEAIINTNLINRFIYDSTKPERAGMCGETHFYLLRLNGNEKLGSWDKILEHGWFSVDEILTLLPYADEKAIFLQAANYIKSLHQIH